MRLHISYTMLTVVIVDILATSGDITMSWTSPMYPKLYSHDPSINPLDAPITEVEDSWIGSLINVGAMLGPLPFGYIGERFGRKVGLLCIAVPHIISYMTMAFAKNVYLFYFGRFFGGLAVGGGYTLLPMYIAEISEEVNRGFYSATLGIFWGFGNFLPLLIGPFLSVMWFNLVLACFPIIFFLLFLIIGSETPYYLVGQNRIKEAEDVLMFLRSTDKQGIEKEVTQIKRGWSKQDGHFKDIIMNAGQRQALIVAVLFILFQQFSGLNAITFYLEPIFNASGSSLSPDISSMLVGAVIFFSSFITPAIINIFRRKTLTLVSVIGLALSLFTLGAYFHLLDHHQDVSGILWMPLACLVLTIFSFQIGLATLPWMISSELFPKDTKQIAATVASSACWVGSFLVTKFFRDMTNLLNNSGAFWFFGGCCVACAVFTIVWIPETKGKTFLQIQEMMQRKKSVMSIIQSFE